ncbi:hypothetical protein [Photobacterium profundum]
MIIAGLAEVGWAIGLKYTDGLTKPVSTVPTLILLTINVLKFWV